MSSTDALQWNTLDHTVMVQILSQATKQTTAKTHYMYPILRCVCKQWRDMLQPLPPASVWQCLKKGVKNGNVTLLEWIFSRCPSLSTTLKSSTKQKTTKRAKNERWPWKQTKTVWKVDRLYCLASTQKNNFEEIVKWLLKEVGPWHDAQKVVKAAIKEDNLSALEWLSKNESEENKEKEKKQKEEDTVLGYLQSRECFLYGIRKGHRNTVIWLDKMQSYFSAEPVLVAARNKRQDIFKWLLRYLFHALFTLSIFFLFLFC